MKLSTFSESLIQNLGKSCGCVCRRFYWSFPLVCVLDVINARIGDHMQMLNAYIMIVLFLCKLESLFLVHYRRGAIKIKATIKPSFNPACTKNCTYITILFYVFAN